MPVLRAVVGVQRIDTIAGRSHIGHVVGATCDAYVGNDQRLRIHLVVYGNLEQKTELVHVDVRRRQRGFAQVLPCSTEVIVLGNNTDLGMPDDSGQENQKNKRKQKS